jgi:ribosome-binding factor A
MISEVVPAPDAHRMLVSVCPFTPDDEFNPTLVLERLQKAVGRLRSEVARSISRRKVPELAFRVVLNEPPVPPRKESPNAQ